MLKNYELIFEPEETIRVFTSLDRSPIIALDLETTGLDFHRSEIHGVSLASADREFYVCHAAVLPLLENLGEFLKDKRVPMHNGVFDLHFLRKHGVDVENVVDTMVGQFLVDENQRIGLKELARTKLGIKGDLPDFNDLRSWVKRILGKKRLDEISIFDLPLNVVAEYAARDARLTFDLWEKTEYELAAEGMKKHFFEIEMPFLRVLLDMEEAGFYIDQKRLDEVEQEFLEKRETARANFDQITGGVNPNSDKQLVEYFYVTLGYPATRFTATNQPSVDVVSMTRLLPRDKNGAVAALLEFRKYDKLISTYTTPFRERLYNGRLYGSFNQTGCVTGRLSSSDPNLQNIPARGETGSQVRELFAAPPGYTFLDIDYSQLELRILAHYTKDANLLKVFAENGDPHQTTVDLMASLGFNIIRRDAKSVNFGWAYGIGPRSLCDQIEKSSGVRPKESDARQWLKGFEEAYPSAPRWKYRVIDYARELGYVKTIAGRKRRLPDLKSPDPSLRAAAERQSVNSIIQGTASDIIKWAMLQIYPVQKEYKALMLAQVHDELCWQALEDTVEEFAGQARQLMEAAGEFYNLRVKLVAEPGYGPNWAASK